VGQPFRREAHPEQRSLANDGGWRHPADSGSLVTRHVGERRLEIHGGLVNRFGEGREDGSSPGVLSTVAWIGRRGTAWWSGHRVTGVGVQAVEGQGTGGGLVVVKTRVGGGQRWRPSMRCPRWK
jgi:hypothetical protein